MGLNTKIQDKYKESYENLQSMIPIQKMYGYYYDDMEIWRDITSSLALGVIDNAYQISTHGRVYNKITGTFLHPYKNPKGYLTVSLQCTNYKLNHRVYKVHRLVMLHFAFRPDCYLLEIDHRDTDKTNNHISNLEWVTPQENTHRAIKSGLRKLSCSASDGILLSDEDAHKLFYELDRFYSYDEGDIEYIVKKYNVSTNYAKDLYKGKIRPYIANKFYNRYHYDSNEEKMRAKNSMVNNN